METSAANYELSALALYTGIAVVLVLGLLTVSALLGGRSRGSERNQPYESGVAPVGSARLRLSAKFYLIALFFVIFDLEAVYLFAWAIALRETGWAGFAEAAVFIAVLMAGLGYLWRLGALDWGPSHGGKK